MSNRYTTNNKFFYGYPIYDGPYSQSFGTAGSQEGAKLICRLLNEDDAGKKLTQDEIDYAINTFQDHLAHYNGRDTKDEDIPKLKNLITFLQTLEGKKDDQKTDSNKDE